MSHHCPFTLVSRLRAFPLEDQHPVARAGSSGELGRPLLAMVLQQTRRRCWTL